MIITKLSDQLCCLGRIHVLETSTKMHPAMQLALQLAKTGTPHDVKRYSIYVDGATLDPIGHVGIPRASWSIVVLAHGPGHDLDDLFFLGVLVGEVVARDSLLPSGVVPSDCIGADRATSISGEVSAIAWATL